MLPAFLPSPFQVAEAALGAIGALTIARPSILVDKRAPAHRCMKEALSPVSGGSAGFSMCLPAGLGPAHALPPPHFQRLDASPHPLQSAPEAFKLRALANLIDLLKADEESMLNAQQEGGGGADGGPGAAVPLVAGGSGRKRGGAKKKGAAGAAGAAEAEAPAVGLQVQNGEGDTLSQSSSILQDNWDAVLALATDTSPAPPGASAASPPGSAGKPGQLAGCSWQPVHEPGLPGPACLLVSSAPAASYSLLPPLVSCLAAGGLDLAPGTRVRRRVVELMELVLRCASCCCCLIGWAPAGAAAMDSLDSLHPCAANRPTAC